MSTLSPQRLFGTLLFVALLAALTPRFARAEDPDHPKHDASTGLPAPATPADSPDRTPASQKRQYMVDNEPRTDAGVFHVGFAAGGNFYIEPQYTLDQSTGLKSPNGSYYKDFGFQGGVYFDYDYSEMEDNIPLMLRGMIGYKYILNSTNVFTFDGVVRRQFRLSEKANFGVGAGGSVAIWYRTESDDDTVPVTDEQIVFLPSFIITAGFEFDPFMVDFKWLINKIGDNDTIMGFEMYFGFRL